MRVERSVGELLGEEHRRPALVEEARVVAAVLDAQVVSVEGSKIELVARNLLEERDGDRVRAVAVDFVVDVETVTRIRAVPDHVHLDHADDGLPLGLHLAAEPVGVGVAAPQALLLAREVDDVNSAVETAQSVDGAGCVVERDRTRAVIFGTRSLTLFVPRPAGSGVEVGAEHENLVGVLLAGDDVANVVVLGAADRVGPQLGNDAGGLVGRDHVLGCKPDAAFGGVRVASDHGLGLTIQDVGLVTGEMSKHRLHVGDVHLVESRLNARIGRRQIVDRDERTRQCRGATLFFLVVLAVVRVNMTVVVRVELVERLVEVLVVAVTTILGFGILALLATDAGANEDDKQRESEER